MPTQDNSEASPSESETRDEKKSITSDAEAKASAATSSSDTVEPTRVEELTVEEALAIAWTGIEALAGMKRALLYRSPKTGRVVIILQAVDLDPRDGLKPLAV